MSRFDYIASDEPGMDVVEIIGEIPRRWGRMDRMSRLAVVEVGRVIGEAGVAFDDIRTGILKGGLIGATRYGSLTTDLEYAETLERGLEVASPTLFSYTLPNISLAEAASHYGLTGPVYSLFSEKPLSEAEEGCRNWLTDNPELDFMIAGEIDVYPASITNKKEKKEIISATFTIVRQACRT